jgi:hypothetical protein
LLPYALKELFGQSESKDKKKNQVCELKKGVVKHAVKTLFNVIPAIF